MILTWIFASALHMWATIIGSWALIMAFMLWMIRPMNVEVNQVELPQDHPITMLRDDCEPYDWATDD